MSKTYEADERHAYCSHHHKKHQWPMRILLSQPNVQHGIQCTVWRRRQQHNNTLELLLYPCLSLASSRRSSKVIIYGSAHLAAYVRLLMEHVYTPTSGNSANRMMPPRGLPVRCRNTSYMICTAVQVQTYMRQQSVSHCSSLNCSTLRATANSSCNSRGGSNPPSANVAVQCAKPRW
jgi:hypothetical protein